MASRLQNAPQGPLGEHYSGTQDPQTLIGLLQTELSTTNHEVMLLTLELEQRVAERMAELSQINQELRKEISERRRAEEEVNRLNQDLEQRAALLEAANRDLEAFSYSVSHDLRSPLRHILGFVGMLQEEGGAVLGERLRHYLDKIKVSATRMSDLIDDLLQFSRCSHAELKRELVDLNAMIDTAIRELEQETKGRDIAWMRVELPVVWGDAGLLTQVLVNLLSNALKYTRPCDRAEIEIGFLNTQAGEIAFYVRDNGVGFDPRYQDKLFGVFQRLHGGEFEGTGVGLANVRRIVARHGGRTWAQGKPGEGATFYFSLPLEEEQRIPCAAKTL